MATQGNISPDPDQLTNAASSLAQAKQAADELKTGTASQNKLDLDREALPNLIAGAQGNIVAAQVERASLLAQLNAAQGALAQTKAALDDANAKLAKVATTPKGEPLAPGMWISGKATLGLTIFTFLLGTAAGFTVKWAMDRDSDKKKELPTKETKGQLT